MHKHLHTCELNHLHDCVCIELLGKSNISEVKLYQCKDIHSNKETLIQSNKHCNKLFTVKKMFKKDKLFYKNVDIRNLLLNEFNIGYSVNECIYFYRLYSTVLILLGLEPRNFLSVLKDILYFSLLLPDLALR